ncbi:MAG: sugar phosphate nucleotidyltransferase [Clostridia bacterium]
MHAIILAAGYATRLYPLTLTSPKALLPIGNKPIIEFILDEMATLPNLSKVVIVSNHKFISHFELWLTAIQERQQYPNLELILLDDGSINETDRLGAIGDIEFAISRANLNEDLLVAAGDNFFTFPLSDYVSYFHMYRKDAICAKHIADKSVLQQMGVAIVDSELRLLTMEEKPSNPSSDIGVYALYIYTKDTLPLFHEYLTTGNNPDAPGNFPVWLVKRKEVRVYLFKGDCIDIGTPEVYAAVNAQYK